MTREEAEARIKAVWPEAEVIETPVGNPDGIKVIVRAIPSAVVVLVRPDVDALRMAVAAVEASKP